MQEIDSNVKLSDVDPPTAAELLSSAASALQPAAAALQPATALLQQKLERVLAPALAAAAPHATAVAQRCRQHLAAVDTLAAGLQPWQLIAATAVATLLLLRLLQALRSAARTLQDKGALLFGHAAVLAEQRGTAPSRPLIRHPMLAFGV